MEKIPILHIRPFIVSGLISLLSAGAIIYGTLPDAGDR